MKSYAKINLDLKVLGKRNDGYHNLESKMVLINFYDLITIKKSKKMIVDSKIENDITLKILNNLKNKNLIRNNYKVKIKKKIPIGAGLGGGSSNAALLLNYLNKKEMHLSNSDLIKISAEFGSDIPFFINNKNAIIKGKGEILTPYEYKLEKNILIVNPNIFISTKNIFLNYNHEKHEYNDLVPTIYKLYPNLKKIIDDLNNLFNVEFKITGSGSTFYLIANKSKLKKIKKNLKNTGYFTCITKIL